MLPRVARAFALRDVGSPGAFSAEQPSGPAVASGNTWLCLDTD